MWICKTHIKNDFLIKYLLIIGILLANILTSNADDFKFTASVQRNPVTQGERFQVTYTLYNAQGTRFTPPAFKGFTALMGPSTSQSTQIINGQMSQQVSYTYVLQADNIGTYTIGPAVITVNGNQIKSNSLTVNVLEPNEAEKQRRDQAQQQEKSLSQQAQDVISKNIFVTLSVSKNSVYLGEQITVTYKIFVHPELNIQSLSPKKEPSFNGFWAQQFELKNVVWQNENRNGVPFKSAVIKKVILLPQQSGKLVIEPYSFDCIARLRVQGQQQRRRRSMFDDFFDDPFFGGGSYKDFSYVASSPKQVINVKSLPEPQPTDFNGGVGSIQLDSWIDRPKAKTGEPISLKVKISGTGNLKLIEPLELSFPPDFDVYDPKVADNVIVSESGISGNKIFEYLLLPKHAGEFRIDPVSFSYFDLNKQKYVTLSSNEFIINVEQGVGGETSSISGVQKEDVQFLGKDIRFIKTNGGIAKDKEELFGSVRFFIFSISPICVFLFLILLKRQKDKLEGNQQLLKNKRATKIAKKRLVNAKKYLVQKDKDNFYEEITHALWGYISDKLSIPVAELTKDSTSKALYIKNINDALINRYLETIDHSEFARFAPSTEESGMERTYYNAVSVISELEGVLR